MKVGEHTVQAFIERPFTPGDARLLSDGRLTPSVALVREGNHIRAAQEYQTMTGASLEECHLAVSFVQALHHTGCAP